MSKRSNGEGSVRQRPNGTWEARLSYLDPATETRKSVSFYGPTDADVREQMKNARDRIDREEPVKDSKQKLADYMKHWSETTLEASTRAESTKSLYRSLARKHIKPALGHHALGSIKKSHIEGLIVSLRKQGLSPSTIRTVYTVLRAILDDAKADELIATNPATKVARPDVPTKEATYLNAAQVVAVLNAAEGLRYATVLRLLAGTGLRRGEALALHWSDVNLDDGYLKVKHTLGRVGKELLLTEPKTKRSKRRVPLSPRLVAMLRRHKAQQAAEKLKAGSLWQDREGLVFTTELGGKVEPRNILRTMEIAAKRATWIDSDGEEHTGVEGAVVHSLRHSAANEWLESGTHIVAVSHLLGHYSTSITGDLYGHASDEVMQSAIEGASERFGL